MLPDLFSFAFASGISLVLEAIAAAAESNFPGTMLEVPKLTADEILY
jgi:hypothetical protein